MKREIVFLARGIPRHGMGGMEIVVWDLAKEFARLGFPVRVITTAIPNVDTEYKEDGVTVVPLEDAPTNRYSWAWWRESRCYFEGHCMSSTLAILSVSAAGFGLLPIKQELHGIPFIMQAHGTSWGEVLSKWGSRRLLSILSSVRNLSWLPKDLLAYRKFDAIVAVGVRVSQDLMKPPVSWALSKHRVHLINNGIDTNLFSPSEAGRMQLRKQLRIGETTPVVISASRLHAQKGLEHGLRAFATFLQQQPDAVFLIAGDGPEKGFLESLAVELGIGSSVLFLGSLIHTELAKYLQAADLFLFLTDRIEVGLSLNVLEALASGLPVVISEHLQVYPSSAITLVNQRDPEMVSAALVKVISDSERQYKSLLRDEYTLGISAGYYIDLIKHLSK